MRISDWSSDVCSSDLCGACPNDVGGLLSRRYGLAGKAGCDLKRTLWLVALSPSGERYGGLPACWLAGVERGISPLQASLAPDGASFAILSPEGERAKWQLPTPSGRSIAQAQGLGHDIICRKEHAFPVSHNRGASFYPLWIRQAGRRAASGARNRKS